MSKPKGKKDVSPLDFLAKAATGVPSDDKAETQWPTLWRCLAPIWKDGECKRQSGRLSIRISGSWFVVTLACPTEAIQTSVASSSLSDLFDALEAKLASGTATFEPDWESTKKTRQVRIDSVKTS